MRITTLCVVPSSPQRKPNNEQDFKNNGEEEHLQALWLNCEIPQGPQSVSCAVLNYIVLSLVPIYGTQGQGGSEFETLHVA